MKNTKIRHSRRIAVVAVATALMLAASSAMAGTDSLIRSLILPGAGQAHDGHYTRAALFATSAIGSWVGFFATQINYNRAVERYDSQKALYQSYGEQLANGETVAWSDLSSTRDNMLEAWNLADDRVRYRNIFAVALITTYAVNIIDILTIGEETGELDRANKETSLNLYPTKDGFALVKSFHF